MVDRYEGAFTYSRLNDYDQCRLLFKLRHIEKRKEPDSPHFVKGNRIHEGIDMYLKKRANGIPLEAKPLAKELSALRNDKTLRGEEAWGFDDSWEPLPVTGYFSKRDHIRAKIDALRSIKDTAIVIDFKSGQVRDASEDQVRFYGVLTLLRELKFKIAKLQLWFVEHGQIKEYEPVLRKDVAALKKGYADRFKKIQMTSVFEPTPGVYCRWCPFSKHKGGPCKF